MLSYNGHYQLWSVQFHINILENETNFSKNLLDVS